MSESWASIMGESNPEGWSDLKKGLEKAAKMRLIYLDKKSSGHVSDVAKKMWELADGDAGKIVRFFDNAVKGRHNESYLMGGAEKTDITKKGFRRSNQAAFQPNREKEISTFPADKKISPDDSSWDKIYRTEFDHWTWKDPRHWPAKMWTEIAHNFPKPWDRKIYIDGHSFTLEAGKIATTERQLARRYGTTKTQVHTLLVKLESDGMITRESIPRWKELQQKQQPDDGPLAGPDDGPSEKPSQQPRRLASVTLITICNYWNYHTKVDRPKDDPQPTLQPSKQPLAGPDDGPSAGPHIIEVKKEEPEIKPPTPLKIIRSEDYLEAYEKNRGSMESLDVGGIGGYLTDPSYLQMAQEIRSNFLANSGDDERLALEKFTEMVKYAGAHVHESRLFYVRLKWFAKSMENCREVYREQYKKSFSQETGNGKSKEIRKYGKGGAEEFRGKSDSSRGTAKLAAIARAQMSKV